VLSQLALLVVDRRYTTHFAFSAAAGRKRRKRSELHTMVLNGIFGNDAYDNGVGHQAMFSKQSELFRQRVAKEDAHAPFGEFGNVKRLSVMMKTPWTMQAGWLSAQDRICTHPQAQNPKTLALIHRPEFKNIGPTARQRMIFSNMSWDEKLYKGEAVEKGVKPKSAKAQAVTHTRVVDENGDRLVQRRTSNTFVSSEVFRDFTGFDKRSVPPKSAHPQTAARPRTPTARPLTPANNVREIVPTHIRLNPVSKSKKANSSVKSIGSLIKGLQLIGRKKNNAVQPRGLGVQVPLPAIGIKKRKGNKKTTKRK